ncbi:hypothetical protein EON65_57175, partial [archaeon]
MIRLSASTDQNPGDILNLPLTIPQPKLTLSGSAPPKLRHIYSNNATGRYAVGDRIVIATQFFAPVTVFHTPALELNTGCSMNRLRPNGDDCLVTEIQQFTCVAEQGAFSIRLGDQVIPNVFVNTTALTLQRRFQQLDGVVSVVVNITSTSDNPYYYNRVCSPEGNQVRVHFLRVFFPHLHGDLPPLLF